MEKKKKKNIKCPSKNTYKAVFHHIGFIAIIRPIGTGPLIMRKTNIDQVR
jgi:hypothetical protein